jgi:PAS domain S-box-containing protein
MNDRDGSNVKLETKLNLPHVENEIELVTDVTNTDATYQKDETEEHIAELIITNEENVLALFNVNKELDLQIDESEKRSVELVNAYRELKDIDLKLAIQKVEKEKRAAELIIANKELAFQNEEKEKRAAELIIANKELAFQNKEKEKRAVELIIANKELAFQITEHNHAEEVLKESEERFRTIFENSTIGIYRTTPDGQILLANPTLLKLLGYSSFEELASRNLTEEGFEPLYDRTLFIDVLKREGKVTGLESAWTRMDGTTLFISESARAINNKEGKIIYYDGIVEDITLRKKVEQELILSYKELTFQNKEKEKRANELIIANKELAFQNEEKEKRAHELVVANVELAFQNEQKEKRATELIIANKELLFQNNEKEKRAAELIIANKELAFQDEEKEKRAAELIIANKELLFQNNEKEKRAAELILAHKVFLQSEKNFRLSISKSPLGIRINSVEGDTIYVNKTFLDIYELNNLDEYRSISSINLYTPESYVEHLTRENKRKKGEEEFEYEVSIVRKNGGIRYLKVWRKEILWNEKKHYQVIILDITEQKLGVEALKSSQQQLRNFATHLQNIREEEKVAIAREIHDDLGQILVALKIDLGLFKHKILKGSDNISPEEILGKFDDLSNLVDKTIKTTRRIMTGLRPEIIDSLGFIEAAKSYLLEFEERHHLPCHFNCTISELNIIPQQSVALFRILQEALNNVVKHAKATAVKIHMSIHINKLILEIKDNGIGFDENHKGRQDSYGMIGMKERVTLLEGELTITGITGKGTCVKVEMPYLLK